jgi:sucrose-6-phosphate hydrolase SacC (GH32 family)
VRRCASHESGVAFCERFQRREEKLMSGARTAICVGIVLAAGVQPPIALGQASAPVNPGFESGDLAGWTVVSGTAFSEASVTGAGDWGWGGPFNHEGRYHLWGFRPGGDGATGELRSSTFTLSGGGSVSLRVSGGYDPDRLYVALARASDHVELFRTTALEDEAYRCVGWAGSAYVGEQLYVKVVDRATGGWGHINLDAVDTEQGKCGAAGLTPIALPSRLPEPGTVDMKTWYGADPYRPQYHFSAVQNWINDPNGLIRWRGEYHLFYQHNPHAPTWGPMHWGHAVSQDLVHWRHLPIALFPEPTSIDGDVSGIFSGSAVDHDGELSLLYTQFTDPAAHPGAPPETVGLATSTDGRTFTKFPGNPVIAGPPASAGTGWRDPKVFKDADGRYKLVVGSGDAMTGRGNVQLYLSPDLRQWQHLGVLFEGDGTNGRMWECPDLFPLGDDGKWVLLVSVNDSGIQKAVYFVGTFADDRFVPETSGELDLGLDFYATQTFRDDQGRRIAIGWMNRWGGRMPERLNGWGGAMSVPRELFLLPNGRLGSRPVAELRDLRGARAARLTDVMVSGLRHTARGDAMEIVAEFDAAGAPADSFGLVVRRSPDGSEQTRIAYDASERTVSVDRTRSGIGDRDVVGGPIEPSGDGTLRLRVLLDRSSVEVFADDRSAVTARIHPNHRESDGVALFADGGRVRLKALTAWQMKSAW